MSNVYGINVASALHGSGQLFVRIPISSYKANRIASDASAAWRLIYEVKARNHVELIDEQIDPGS